MTKRYKNPRCRHLEDFILNRAEGKTIIVLSTSFLSMKEAAIVASECEFDEGFELVNIERRWKTGDNWYTLIFKKVTEL